jgi:hypothetical protein
LIKMGSWRSFRWNIRSRRNSPTNEAEALHAIGYRHTNSCRPGRGDRLVLPCRAIGNNLLVCGHANFGSRSVKPVLAGLIISGSTTGDVVENPAAVQHSFHWGKSAFATGGKQQQSFPCCVPLNSRG